MTKQLIRFSTAVMVTLLALMVLWQFRSVLGYVFISLTLAATLRPLVSHFTKRGWMAWVFWILAYLIVLGSFGILLFLAGENVFNEIKLLTHTVSVQDVWMLPTWLQGSTFQQTLVEQLPAPSKFFEALTGDQGQLVLPAILGLTQGIGGLVSDILVIMFLSLYWSINQFHFERLWLSLLPSEQRKQARDIWRTIELDLGAYIRSELVQSLLAMLLLGAGYWLLGSPYPSLMAIVGGLAWLVPVAGAPLAVILPLVMGLLNGIQLSVVTTFYTLLVLISLQIWVEPRLSRRKWNNPILTMVIVLGMADAFGLPGILVAPPISAICQIMWNLMVFNRSIPRAATQVSDLKERLASSWEIVHTMNEPPMALVTNSMERLSQLIEKAELMAQAGFPVKPGQPTSASQPNSADDRSLSV